MTLAEVADFVTGLPGVTTGEGDRASWSVGSTRAFAWERPFSQADRRRYGDEPVPEGTIVAVRTADLNDKEAVLAAGHPGVFTIPHFDGYAAVLVQLSRVHKRVLRDLLTDAWRVYAPAE